MNKDPNKVAARWAQNLGASTQKIKEGVDGVSVSPTAKAAQQKQKWIANVQGSADKWARNLNAVSLQEWQRAFNEKGLPRIASGASNAQGKMTNFFNQLLPYIEQQKSAIDSMPTLTLEDSINKMAAWVRIMSKFQAKK